MRKPKKDLLMIKLFPAKPVPSYVPARTTIWRYKQRQEDRERYEEIKKKDRERKKREYDRNKNDDSNHGRHRKAYIREQNRIRQRRYRARLKAQGITRASDRKLNIKKTIPSKLEEENVNLEIGSVRQREYLSDRNDNSIKERHKKENIREKNRLRQRQYRARLKANGIIKASDHKQNKKKTLPSRERDNNGDQETASGKQREYHRNRNDNNKGRHKKKDVREQNRIRQRRFRARLKAEGITKASDRKQNRKECKPSRDKDDIMDQEVGSWMSPLFIQSKENRDRHAELNNDGNKGRQKTEDIREQNRIRQRRYRAKLKAEGITRAYKRKQKKTVPLRGEGDDNVGQERGSGKQTNHQPNKGRSREEVIREKNRLRQRKFRARLKAEGITRASERKQKITEMAPSIDNVDQDTDSEKSPLSNFLLAMQLGIKEGCPSENNQDSAFSDEIYTTSA